MFGWFKPKQPDPKLMRAYQLGRQSAESFANDLERLMQIRFGPVADGYLGVLQGQLNKCLNPTNPINAPPIFLARNEYKIFMENLDKLREQMTAEIQTTLADWLALADLRENFIELIGVKISDYHGKLLADGLQRLLDMVNALKLADGQWRAAHPELSAKFPADTGKLT